ncbi:MAG: LysR family transcriptional regulator [Bradyrhizobium sp.]|nr:LysR family transcriptional regulator [Bradyrhizobium sp.]
MSSCVHPFDLNLRHLRALSAIATRGSMSAAADAVSLSQPALTQGLAKLERQLGVALFERRPDGMRATAEGAMLAARAAAALAHLATAGRGPSRGARGFARPELLMTATQLRAFLALADAGSFVGAAGDTGLSQPALHRAVRDLEQLCATRLAERRGRGVSLTVAGRRLARGVRLAAAEIAAAMVDIDPSAGLGGARIVIGAMPLCRALILPRVLARFTHEMPGVNVEVVEGSWRELVDPLRDGIVDLMIGALREEAPPDVEQVALMVDQLVVIGRAGHPLAGRTAVSLAALAEMPWIVGQRGTPLRNHWEAMFAAIGLLPAAPIECGSVMTIRGVLCDSDFLTLLSPDQVALELDAGILAMIDHRLAGGSRTIGITTRTGWRPTGAQSRFVALVGQAASETRLSKN